MANAFEKFPGHAYAPGKEPKFWDQLFQGDPDVAIGLISNTTLALGAIALVLYAVRVFGPRTRLKFTGNSDPIGSCGQILSSKSAGSGHATVLGSGIDEGSLARALRHSRTKRADHDHYPATASRKVASEGSTRRRGIETAPEASLPPGPREAGSS